MGSMGTKFEFKFKQENSDVNQRKQSSDKIKQQFQDKIPIIVEKDPRAKTLDDIDKTKYLVPKEISVTQFSFMLRKRLQLKENDAFFLIAKCKYTIMGENTMDDVYNKYSDKDDGYLYITYTSKEIWGSN